LFSQDILIEFPFTIIVGGTNHNNYSYSDTKSPLVMLVTDSSSIGDSVAM